MKSAFNLAETLITIGIIGVVAAMALPSVVSKYQKHATVAKLKKAYSILSQVLERNYFEQGGMGDFVTTGSKVTKEKTEAYFNTFWFPYFDSPLVSPEGAFPYGKSVPLLGFDNTTYSVSVTTSYKDGRLFFTTKDGISYYIFTLLWEDEKDDEGNIISQTMTYASNMQVFVDIDGTKGENKLGKDVFLFYIDTEKNILHPAGYNLAKSTVDRNCRADGNGIYCSSKILNDGWEITYY